MPGGRADPADATAVEHDLAADLWKCLGRPVQVPDEPLGGLAYVFHHRLPMDNERFALSELPRRLRALGITITSGSDRASLMYLFLGGPLYRIRVRARGRSGVIYNKLDNELMKLAGTEWSIEDHVLLWNN